MLADLDRPVLVVEAGADPLIAVRHFQTLTATTPGARASSLPDMSHDPLPNAPEVAAAMAAFASGVDAR